MFTLPFTCATQLFSPRALTCISALCVFLLKTKPTPLCSIDFWSVALGTFLPAFFKFIRIFRIIMNVIIVCDIHLNSSVNLKTTHCRMLPLILAVKNNVDSEAAFEAVETVAGFEEVDGNN